MMTLPLRLRLLTFGGGAREPLLGASREPSPPEQSGPGLSAEDFARVPGIRERPATGQNSGISAAELASLLGNQTARERHPPSQPEAEGEVEEVGPSGEELLDALEGDDSALAASVARRAGRKAVNYKDGPRRSALLLASMEGHVDAVRVLLGREDFLSANARNTIGSTALHMAAANSHKEVVQVLLGSRRFCPPGGVNAVNDNGQTALDFAMEFGEGVATDLLVAAGGRSTGPRMGRGRVRLESGPALRRRRPGVDTIAEDRDDDGFKGEAVELELEEDEGHVDSLD